MGREAIIFAEAGSEAGEVRALLESRELILRGEIRRRIPLEAIENLAVADEDLIFVKDGERVQLRLGSVVALRWKKAIETPPPNLKSKLGITDGARVFYLGVRDDAILDEAIRGMEVPSLASATLAILRIDHSADLESALVQLERSRLPVWAAYRKGLKAGFGDRDIRTRFRSVGYVDTKSCNVSERLTATRYTPNVGGGNHLVGPPA